jgi:hypothetical protein
MVRRMRSRLDPGIGDDHALDLRLQMQRRPKFP